MNLTLPSVNSVLTPPGWVLEALAKVAWSGQPPPVWRQALQAYCLELGVTTVLNSVSPTSPTSQKRPRAPFRPLAATQLVLQAVSAFCTPVALAGAVASRNWPTLAPETLTMPVPG